MHAQLNAFFERPAPFATYTVDALWTDPHRAGQMLACHLDPESDLASRRPERIDAIITWLDDRLGFAGKTVTDLGCGPGLYAERLARRGARVTGLDFSEGSIAHARAHAASEGLEIAYAQADYLKDELPADQDMVMLIYGDLCPLSPERRRQLYAKIIKSLKPGGAFVCDLFSTAIFAGLNERQTISHSPTTGFWAKGPHTVITNTLVYPDDKIALDRYLVVTESGTQDIWNWMQYFDAATLRAELEAAGFAGIGVYDTLTGGAIAGDAETFMAIART